MQFTILVTVTTLIGVGVVIATALCLVIVYLKKKNKNRIISLQDHDDDEDDDDLPTDEELGECSTSVIRTRARSARPFSQRCARPFSKRSTRPVTSQRSRRINVLPMSASRSRRQGRVSPSNSPIFERPPDRPVPIEFLPPIESVGGNGSPSSESVEIPEYLIASNSSSNSNNNADVVVHDSQDGRRSRAHLGFPIKMDRRGRRVDVLPDIDDVSNPITPRSSPVERPAGIPAPREFLPPIDGSSDIAEDDSDDGSGGEEEVEDEQEEVVEMPTNPSD